MISKKYEDNGKLIGIIGATGAVGKEIIKVLAERNELKVKELILFASARSVGNQTETPFGPIVIELFTVEKTKKLDILFLAVSGSFSKQYAIELATGENSPLVIDNSSAFRLDPSVPLVIPEINGNVVQNNNVRLIANPNCTTAIAAMVLWPLHLKYHIKNIIISTYQAASGAGAEGIEELITGTKNILNNEEQIQNKIFAHPLPFNVIPHIDVFQDNKYTKEEMKVVYETKKIFNSPNMNISCTAVRVPILRAHSESITIETELPIDPMEATKILMNAKGVDVCDDIKDNKYPMPLTATNKNNVEVGRIRQSLVYNTFGLDLFVCGDQLLRGAALNAVLIAEYIEKPYKLDEYIPLDNDKKDCIQNQMEIVSNEQNLNVRMFTTSLLFFSCVIAFSILKK